MFKNSVARSVADEVVTLMTLRGATILDMASIAANVLAAIWHEKHGADAGALLASYARKIYIQLCDNLASGHIPPDSEVS